MGYGALAAGGYAAVYGSGGVAKLVGGACGALENESAVPAPLSPAGKQWRRSVHTLPSLHSTQQCECDRPSKLSQGQPRPGHGTLLAGRVTIDGEAALCGSVGDPKTWRRLLQSTPSRHSRQQNVCGRPSKLSQGQPGRGHGTLTGPDS
jgi:hypothetical protein